MTCSLLDVTWLLLPSAWSLGEANARLSYYDGLIQLSYSNGSKYNNKEHTFRSTLISFLCDPEAGAGKPEFQVNVVSLLFPFSENGQNCLHLQTLLLLHEHESLYECVLLCFIKLD